MAALRKKASLRASLYQYTDPNIIKLVPGQTYSIAFSYKILTEPDIDFEVLFYSKDG
jgi:hypothetical protein